MNIPADKRHPPDAGQCDDCGGHGCLTCNKRGWLKSGHPRTRLCWREACRKPIPPAHVAVYCTDKCASEDAEDEPHCPRCDGDEHPSAIHTYTDGCDRRYDP
jgi:hypothetical protein